MNRSGPTPHLLRACAFAAIALVSSSLARADILIAIDTARQRMTVSVDGVSRWTWPGARDHLTPVGSYRVARMARHHVSKEWDDIPEGDYRTGHYGEGFSDMGRHGPCRNGAE